MNEDLVESRGTVVVFLDNVVNMRHSRADEKRKDEGCKQCSMTIQTTGNLK